MLLFSALILPFGWKLWFFCSPHSISTIIVNFCSFIGNLVWVWRICVYFCALCMCYRRSHCSSQTKYKLHFCDDNNSALPLIRNSHRIVHWFDFETAADSVDTKTFNRQIWTMVHKMPPRFHRLLCGCAAVDFSVNFDYNSIRIHAICDCMSLDGYVCVCADVAYWIHDLIWFIQEKEHRNRIK